MTDDFPASERSPQPRGRSSPEDPGDAAAGRRRDKKRERALVGATIAGKYRIVGVLGQGGFGTVYLVEMVTGIVGDRLAMKVLPSELGANERLRDGFVHEIRVAMRMVSRYIVQIRDVGVTDDGLLYYTMDYVPGQSLRDVLREAGVLSPARAVRITLRVLKALVTAHTAGVIHRDLKPANIMVDPSSGRDETTVLDFGIATVVKGAPEEPTFAGSPHYMPPEQFLGTELGFYTDTYAVGVILYECLTGQKPFDGRTPREVYERLKTGSPPRVDELAPEIEKAWPGLSQVVARSIERNPERRFQTAREFYDALQKLAREIASGGEASDDDDAADPEPSRAATSRRKIRVRAPRARSSTPWAIVVVAAALVVGGVIWMILDATRSRSGGRDSQINSEMTTRENPAVPAEGVAAAEGAAAPSAATTAAAGTAAPEPSRGEPSSGTPAPSSADAEISRPQARPRTTTPSDASAAIAEPDKRDPEKLLAEARTLVAQESWQEAYERLDAALGLAPEDSEALELAARVLFELGDLGRARTSLERARSLAADSLSPDSALLLARILRVSTPPAFDVARELVLEVRRARPEDPQAAALLAQIYQAQGEDELLLALVRDARARSIRHPLLDELFETLVVAVEKRREEEHADFAARAVQAFAERRWEEAAEAALEGTARRADAGLELLIADVRLKLERFEDATRAIEKARRLLENATGTTAPTLWRPGAEIRDIERWPDFFASRIEYEKLRKRPENPQRRSAATTLANRLAALAQGAESAALGELAKAYEVAARGLIVDDPATLDRILHDRRESELPEAVFAHSEAYVNLADRFAVEPLDVADARKQRLRAIAREASALSSRRKAIERDRDMRRTDRTKALEEIDKEVAKLATEAQSLQREDAEYEAKKKVFLAALVGARGRLTYLTGISDLPREIAARGFYRLGLVYLRHGEATGQASFLKLATNRLLRAIDLGMTGAEVEERLGDSYALRSDHSEAASRYKNAYELEPTPERCVAAARSFINAVQKSLAREILLAGRERFPSHAPISELLAKLDG